MTITKAELKDIPEIIAIQKLAFYDVAKFYNNFKLGPLQTTIADLVKTFDSYTYFKAMDQGIVGAARAKVTGETCKIENVIIHPSFQNRGIGKNLILALQDSFPHGTTFELLTGKETPKNISFYERLGFVITHEIPATETEPVLVTMKKESL